MKRLSKKNRYLIWSGIWVILFTLIMAFLPLTLVWIMPTILLIIIALGYIKDIADFYKIGQGLGSFLHPHFEHAPLMFILGVYCFYNLVSTGDISWIYLGVAALGDTAIDLYQDNICCIE